MITLLPSSGRMAVALIATVAVALAACGGTNSGHARPERDAATESGGNPADAAPGGESGHDAFVMEAGVADEGTPDVAIVDVGTPETLDDDGGLMVTWSKGCWYEDSGHKYQAMQFTLVTPSPVALEATLDFTTTCDASMGTDNLNDTGGTLGSGSWLFWFIHHPDETSTSAIWSLGSAHSPCIDYSTAPDC